MTGEELIERVYSHIESLSWKKQVFFSKNVELFIKYKVNNNTSWYIF